MRSPRLPAALCAALLAARVLPPATSAADAPRRDDRPNIVVILADDLGYADLGCQGSREVATPRIDSIAANGARCTAGYVSAPQCCPSRAGLVTGRYQNRFGFEANWPPALGRKAGLPPDERTIGDHLRAAGYVTGMIGKWHLGDSEPMRPYNRGFDETLWHANGGILFPDPQTGSLSKVHRGADPARIAEYSTDAFGREAVEFIGRHRADRFLLYLAFVPPHWPMEGKPEQMARFAHVPDLHRRTMLAMMASLDENVGRVLDKLRESDLERETLVFFLSDNGGPTGAPRPAPDAPFEYGQNTSRNDPFRGVKGDLLEGGIRVPYLVQWKGVIPAGRIYDRPVISLDILPTALAAARAKPLPGPPLDGVDLLPHLTGQRGGDPHETLHWRFRFPPSQPALHRWAIRQGDWKLVKNHRDPVALYDLRDDPGEARDLAAEHPGRARAMREAWERWDAANREPLWIDPPQPFKGLRDARAEAYETEIQVRCLGNDPQIVLGDLPAARGPYTLELRAKSACAGPGEVYWSDASHPRFAAERSARFAMQHDTLRWRDHAIALPTPGPITALRLDPGNAPGLIRVARLLLRDADGKLVRAWIGGK